MCLAHTQTFDAARADAFALKLMGMLNGGAIMLMNSIGHRTGLFDALSDHRPAISQELAQKSGDCTCRFFAPVASAPLTPSVMRLIGRDAENRLSQQL